MRQTTANVEAKQSSAQQVAASAEAVALAQTGPCTVCWGGLGQVTDAIAARLTDLRLSTVATTINHTASGVSVHTSTGTLSQHTC